MSVSETDTVPMRTYFSMIMAASFVVAANAQTGFSPIVKNKPADRAIRVSAPVIDSTARFNPQIHPATGQTPLKEVENEFNPFIFDGGSPNNIPLGGLSNLAPTLSINPKWPAIGATGWVPPDPDVAVGPNNVVATVNVAVAFFNKAGVKQFEQDLGANGFFSGMGVSSFVFDPKCTYDPVAKRFYIIAPELDSAATVSKILLAVSDDSDPNGTWYKYRIEAKQTVGSNNYWLDYPGFGFNKDALMVTGNMFAFPGSSGFNGIQYIVIPKAPLLNGGTPTISYFSLGGGSCQVMRGPDANVGTLYGFNLVGASTAMVHAITNPGTTPALTTTTVTIPTFIPPQSGGVSTGGHILDALDGRIMNVQYRFGRLMASHSVALSASDVTNGARWYDININNWPASGTPTLRQAGTVAAGTGTHQFMPAIGINSLGDMAMVFTRCSSAICADYVTSYRRANDPLGTMRAPVLLTTSVGTIYGGASNRWGDYFGCQVDPSDDTTFWGIGMVANASGGWQTVVNSFRVTTPFTGSVTGVAKYEGKSSYGTLTQILNSDNAYFGIGSIPVNRTGEVASAIVNLTVPSASPATVKVDFESSAATYVSATYFVWDWTTSTWTYINATPQTSADKVTTITIPTPYSKYINSGKQMKILLRSIMPYSTTHSAVPYTFKIDQVKISGLQ